MKVLRDDQTKKLRELESASEGCITVVWQIQRGVDLFLRQEWEQRLYKEQELQAAIEKKEGQPVAIDDQRARLACSSAVHSVKA